MLLCLSSMQLLLFKVLLCPSECIGKLCQTNPAWYPPPLKLGKQCQPLILQSQQAGEHACFALKAALPQPICEAGLGASVLCCHPVTVPGDICHRWPGVSVWLSQHSLSEGALGTPRPHPPRPFPCCSKSSWRGKASPSHHWDVPSTETQGPVAWKALQGALGLLRLICQPKYSSIPPVGDLGNATGASRRGAALPTHPVRDRLLGNSEV